MLWPTAIPFLLLLTQKANCSEGDPKDIQKDGFGIENTKLQPPMGTTSVETDDSLPVLTESVVKLTLTTQVENGNFASYQDIIVTTDHSKDLRKLNSRLETSRRRAGDHPESIAEHYRYAVNLMTGPDMQREIAMNADLINKYAPANIIDWIIVSIQDLDADTSRIAPQTISSVEVLQYLFHAGHFQVPKFSLKLKKGQREIRNIYVRWLVKHDCLALLKALFPAHLNFTQRCGLERLAIKNGNLDVLKWLLIANDPTEPYAWLVSAAIYFEKPDIVTWMLTMFGHLIDWNEELSDPDAGPGLYKIIPQLRLRNDIKWNRRVRHLFLIFDGDLKKLSKKYGPPVDRRVLTSVANVAAVLGQVHILQWIYEQPSKSLPKDEFVVRACRNGHLPVLQWFHKICPNAIPTLRPILYTKSVTYADQYSVAALRGGRLEIVKWIFYNLPNNVLSNSKMLHWSLERLSEDMYLEVLDWISSVHAKEMLSMMVSSSSEYGHVQVLRWLHRKGYPIGIGLAKTAAMNGRIDYLMAIHEINPELLRDVEISNSAAACTEAEKYVILEWMWRTYKILPTTFMLWSTVIPFLLLLTQKANCSEGDPEDVQKDGFNLEHTSSQSQIGKTSSLGTLVASFDGLTLAAPSGNKNEIDDAELEGADALTEISTLIDSGRSLDLTALQLELERRRVLANNDTKLTEYCRSALFLMTWCPALNNPEGAVQEALKMGYYEVLRCLWYSYIWEDLEQEHWYWAMLYGKNIVAQEFWSQQQSDWGQFWKMCIKADNHKLYTTIGSESWFSAVSSSELHETIVKYDAINIFSLLNPATKREIALNCDWLNKYVPEKILDQIIESIPKLYADTDHIAPQMVGSTRALK
ncbi:hypothetical protein PSACC_02471, partial [Paramicrosporidium saccamoebae]